MNNQEYFSPLATAEREMDSAIIKYVAILRSNKTTDAQLERAEIKRNAAVAKYKALKNA